MTIYTTTTTTDIQEVANWLIRGFNEDGQASFYDVNHKLREMGYRYAEASEAATRAAVEFHGEVSWAEYQELANAMHVRYQSAYTGKWADAPSNLIDETLDYWRGEGGGSGLGDARAWEIIS